jgi:asparagine N-glycosylation enzyme membrane subunit Stt3
MILGQSFVSVVEAVFSGALFAQTKEFPPSRPDWVIAVVLVVLLLIFGVVACAYLGVFKRKDSRSYGWWW